MIFHYFKVSTFHSYTSTECVRVKYDFLKSHKNVKNARALTANAEVS